MRHRRVARLCEGLRPASPSRTRDREHARLAHAHRRMGSAWRLEPIRAGDPTPLPAAVFAPPSEWPGRQANFTQRTLFDGRFLTRKTPSPAPDDEAPPAPPTAPALRQTTLEAALARATPAQRAATDQRTSVT